MVRARKVKRRLKPVTFTLTLKEYKAVRRIAIEKKITLSQLVCDKVAGLVSTGDESRL